MSTEKEFCLRLPIEICFNFEFNLKITEEMYKFNYHSFKILVFCIFIIKYYLSSLKLVTSFIDFFMWTRVFLIHLVLLVQCFVES